MPSKEVNLREVEEEISLLNIEVINLGTHENLDEAQFDLELKIKEVMEKADSLKRTDERKKKIIIQSCEELLLTLDSIYKDEQQGRKDKIIHETETEINVIKIKIDNLGISSDNLKSTCDLLENDINLVVQKIDKIIITKPPDEKKKRDVLKKSHKLYEILADTKEYIKKEDEALKEIEYEITRLEKKVNDFDGSVENLEVTNKGLLKQVDMIIGKCNDTNVTKQFAKERKGFAYTKCTKLLKMLENKFSKGNGNNQESKKAGDGKTKDDETVKKLEDEVNALEDSVKNFDDSTNDIEDNFKNLDGNLGLFVKKCNKTKLTIKNAKEAKLKMVIRCNKLTDLLRKKFENAKRRNKEERTAEEYRRSRNSSYSSSSSRNESSSSSSAEEETRPDVTKSKSNETEHQVQLSKTIGKLKIPNTFTGSNHSINTIDDEDNHGKKEEESKRGRTVKKLNMPGIFERKPTNDNKSEDHIEKEGQAQRKSPIKKLNIPDTFSGNPTNNADDLLGNESRKSIQKLNIPNTFTKKNQDVKPSVKEKATDKATIQNTIDEETRKIYEKFNLNSYFNEDQNEEEIPDTKRNIKETVKPDSSLKMQQYFKEEKSSKISPLIENSNNSDINIFNKRIIDSEFDDLFEEHFNSEEDELGNYEYMYDSIVTRLNVNNKNIDDRFNALWLQTKIQSGYV